jgi:hypothetical protein
VKWNYTKWTFGKKEKQQVGDLKNKPSKNENGYMSFAFSWIGFVDGYDVAVWWI